MPESVPPRAAWTIADEGWGRRAADFATLAEPYHCREYVAVHHRLHVYEGDRLLDVACGSGLALELAHLRGAACAGIDASQRLVAVARDRNPSADIRVGDMHALPWDDATFDVVTSFRGVWGTTADVVGEIRRVLIPGGRIGLTVWGRIKASPGSWVMAPFALAAAPQVENQAAMVALRGPVRNCWRGTVLSTSNGSTCRSRRNSRTRRSTPGRWRRPVPGTRRSRTSARLPSRPPQRTRRWPASGTGSRCGARSP